MATVTDLLLAQEIFGCPRNFWEQDLGSNTAGGLQGAMPIASWHQPYSNTGRAALINALEHGTASEPYGSLATPDVGSPTVTGGQTTQDTLYQRRPYGLPPPPRPQRPFSEDYPPSYFNPLPWRYLRRAPTDAQGRLLYDSERRRLGATHVAGRRYKDGPDVGLQPDEVMDVLNQLGHPPRFVTPNQSTPPGETEVEGRIWPRSWLYGRFRPGQVRINDNLDPRSEYIAASHELGHVLRLLTELSMNDDGW